MLDPKEEQQFAELKKLARKLHIPIPEAFLTLEVFDKNGKLIQRHRQRSHSWVRNAYNVMFSQLAGKNADDDTFGAGKLNMKKTSGSVAYANSPAGQRSDHDLDSLNQGYMAASAQAGFGILVGYGTAAESLEDYVLENPLIEGTTDDGHHISYVASEATVITYADTTLTATLIRYFNNNEATQSVVVGEVGLVYNGSVGQQAGPTLVARDKLASTVTVPVTGQLKVTYTIQLTYAA